MGSLGCSTDTINRLLSFKKKSIHNLRYMNYSNLGKEIQIWSKYAN